MKKIFLLLLLAVSPLSFVQASDIPINNAGFVQSNIWYSKDPFYAGDSVRIYTFIFNGSVYDLTGDVEFLDNGTAIGKTNFSLSGSGRVQDVWVDWTATQGVHTITAELMNVVADGPAGKQTVALDNSQTGKSDRVVGIDPAVSAAQTQAQVQKVATVGVQAVNAVQNTVQGAVDNVSQSIPSPVRDTVSTGVTAIENFRIAEAAQFQTAKEKKLNEINALNAKTISNRFANVTTSTNSVMKGSPKVTQTSSRSTDTNVVEKPLDYAALIIYSGLEYFFQWQILFYGIILYAVYRFLKWIIVKIRNRE